MDRKFFIPLGILLFFIGITLALNSIARITGLVVIQDVEAVPGSFLGVIFIVLGILSFVLGSRESKKESIHNLIEERGKG